MPKLTWDNWYRSDGCRHWMDVTKFAGTSFTDIFWRGMRLVFLDEKGNKGLLYNGEVYAEAQKIINVNGKMLGFTQSDVKKYLLNGSFKYYDKILNPIPVHTPKLRFEGPDKDDLQNPWQYAEGEVSGSEIHVHFYNMIRHAEQGIGAFQTTGPLPQNAEGINQLAYFAAAVVLHEIMHNHGFQHPYAVDWSPGSDYASTLPQVALQAVLNAAKNNLASSASPIASIFGNVFPPPPHWYNWEDLGGKIIGDVGALAIRELGVIDLYTRDSDLHLSQKYFVKGKWTDWMVIDGETKIYSSPAVVSINQNHRGVYSTGVNGNVLHRRYWDGKWYNWEDLGGKIKGDVGAVTPGGDVTDLYVRGTDDALWQKYYADGKWTDWFLLDNSLKLASSPVVISANPDHRAIFVRGTDKNIYHKYWDGQWHPWQNLKKPFEKGIDNTPITDVGALISSEDTSTLFLRGQDFRLWQNNFDGKKWIGWFRAEAPDFQFQSAPSAISFGLWNKEIFVRGWDGKVYNISWSM
ncbi:hypothetical protein [Fibrella aquatilis]|uniref:PLL-like beta propeller domain-containing protein n=1 Tax=Fibrella aquatilis TaxID=2817059 RepID=A0A939GAE9_9BACT|nr:hypothetical protein [Fibrella aquatilis]MBO0933021.1 hypothetical protein [Fibrella aquatilis]